MIRMKTLKYMPALMMTLAVGATAINGCSAAKDALNDANAGCEGLDAKTSKAQANIKIFNESALALNVKAAEAEAKFLTACNGILTSLGKDTKTTAAAACGDVKAEVDAAVTAGATVNVTVAASCRADASIRAKCEAECTLPECKVDVACEPGKLVVACEGSCSGSCDIQGPELACAGSCEGSCTSDVAVACAGTCEGSCDAPKFDGTCDVGCEVGFSGSCAGTCNGKCDGTDTMGSCAGKCEGSCTAQASGHCEAACKGVFKGPKCEGMCKGTCAVSGGVQCNGTCQGKCVYTPGKADCKGECHGTCTGEASPPRCDGTIDCKGQAECSASCDGKAQASVSCDKPTAQVTVVGNVKLQKAIEANLSLWGEAFNLTLALKEPIATLGGKTGAAFSAIGDVGIAGAACVTSSLSVFVQAQAHISVSAQASLSLSAKSS